MKKNLIIGAAVVSMLAVGATGMAVASSDGQSGAETTTAGNAPQFGPQAGPQFGPQGGEGFFGFGGPGEGHGPGGKDAEKAFETQYLVENAGIDLRGAEEAALAHSPGTIIESKLDDEDNFPVYEVKVLGEDNYVYEYDIEAQGGNIYDFEVGDYKKSFEAQALINFAETSRDEAEQVATGQAPGQVIENKLKEKHGYAVYEVETFENGTLSEVLVNAQSGEILGFETKGSAQGGMLQEFQGEAPMMDEGQMPQGETLPSTGPSPEDADGMPEGPLSDDEDRDDEDRD